MEKFSTKLYLVAVIFMTTATACLGQSQFAKGYVVPIGKDTIKCLIEVRSSYWKITDLRIKADEGAEVRSIPVNEISVFKILSGVEELFIVSNVDLDMKSVNTQNLEEGMSKKIVKQILSLKVLVNAKVSLLTCLDENRKRHFFYKKENEIRELNFIRFLRNGAILELEEYKQQLKNLFADCPKMSGYQGSFSEESFIKAFNNYNQCIGSAVSVSKKEKTELVPSLLLGVNSNSMTFSGDDNYTALGASQASYSSAIGANVGIGLDLASKRQSRFTFGTEILLNKMSTITGNNSQIATPSTYHFDFTSLNLNLAGKYFFVKNGFVKPYLKAGLRLNYLVQYNTSMVLIDLGGASNNYNSFVDLKKTSIGVLAGIGCSIGRANVEVRYNFNGYASSNRASTIHLTSPELQLGYRLKKAK